MANARKAPTEERPPGDTPRVMDATEVARMQAALDAGGLDVRADENGRIDPAAFANAVLKRWPKVMKKLAE